MKWRRLSLRVNACGTVRCEPGWSWRSRTLNDFDLWFVWAGHGQIGLDGERVELSAGSALCLKPGQAYEASHDPRQRLGVSFLHFDFLDAAGRVVIPRGRGAPPPHARLADVDLHERLMRHAVALRQGGTAARRATAGHYVHATLGDMALAGSATTPARRGDDLMLDAARFVRENPADFHSVEALAARAGYTPDHFSKRFRAALGVGPKSYCVRARIERARTLLRESAMGVAEIAEALGYADVFFFSRQFKQQTGVSPSHWRGTS